jgi:hypothetical protein
LEFLRHPLCDSTRKEASGEKHNVDFVTYWWQGNIGIGVRQNLAHAFMGSKKYLKTELIND